MTLYEPSTLATDYLLGALSLGLMHRLQAESARPLTVSARLRISSFAVMALAAFAGGTWHGFYGQFDGRFMRALWNFSQIAGCLWGLLLLLAAVHGEFAGRTRTALELLLCGKFLVLSAVAVRQETFVWVVAEAGSSLLLILALKARQYFRNESPAAHPTTAGVLVSFAGAAVQTAGVAPHPQFNHNDLFHVIQMAALYLFYIGGVDDHAAGR